MPPLWNCRVDTSTMFTESGPYRFWTIDYSVCLLLRRAKETMKSFIASSSSERKNLTFQPSETYRVDNNISSKGSKVQHYDGISPFFLLTESRAPENAHGLPRLCATCSQHRCLREIFEQQQLVSAAVCG